ncbi:hypothetical protein EV126DRAFT_156466 [Verticillium dahliae]|nr:hypothetical protein EV126DRAFT_156466 [Verticillium dahliae]
MQWVARPSRNLAQFSALALFFGVRCPDLSSLSSRVGPKRVKRVPCWLQISESKPSALIQATSSSAQDHRSTKYVLSNIILVMRLSCVDQRMVFVWSLLMLRYHWRLRHPAGLKVRRSE